MITATARRLRPFLTLAAVTPPATGLRAGSPEFIALEDDSTGSKATVQPPASHPPRCYGSLTGGSKFGAHVTK